MKMNGTTNDYRQIVRGEWPVAIITGASGGLGSQIAKELVGRDWGVILSGRNSDRLKDVASGLASMQKSGVIASVHGDLEDNVPKIQGIADIYETRMLVCCAGLHTQQAFAAMDQDTIDEILRVNLSATIKLVRATMPTLMRNMGIILNINSVAGKNIAPGESIYSASKHGLTGFFKSLRMELRQKQVRVMDVYLGAMDTMMTQHQEDQQYLIDPIEAASVIVTAATSNFLSLQVEELTIGRFRFPQ